MEGTRRASMVLPVPGGPIIRTLCAAGGRDLEAALGVRVAAHVGEVEAVALALGRAPARAEGGADLPLAVQILDGLVQGGDRDDLDPLDHAGLAGRSPAGTSSGVKPSRRACRPPAARPRTGRTLAVERQLAHHERAVQPAGLDQPGGAQDADRGRQVEGGAFLAEIGGRQVDGDAVDRELQARVADGGPHPVAALAHGRVGKTDRVERGQPRGDVHLDEDGGGLDPAERGGAYPREHEPSVGMPAGPVNVPEAIRRPDRHIC